MKYAYLVNCVEANLKDCLSVTIVHLPRLDIEQPKFSETYQFSEICSMLVNEPIESYQIQNLNHDNAYPFQLQFHFQTKHNPLFALLHFYKITHT